MTAAVDIFRALADPTRLRIVALLRRMELSVGELAQVLGQSQPRVSRHVKILVDAGVAARRREGSWVFLTPAPSPIAVPLFALIDAGGEDHWAVADAARLNAVRADRATAAERYFAGHAEQWDAIRSLHVADSAVEAHMRDLLGSGLGRLVDIGTGTGRMIELLGVSATHATGIDRSPEMLRLARAKLADAPTPVDFRQADVAELPLADASADTVVMHQVLHYIPAPEAALREAARIVAPGGRLLIVDFASHDREELRTQDAHARLGFSDAQIGGWLGASGLSLTDTHELTGGELTVKLWLGTRPAVAKALAA
ncbi:metalloregulator ArsR/SmtB family transcription factor [Sphingomonas sp. SUN039]|uniref:ArsR/SmtB family transcription factor n=1 Tax=Sphingomonas sp. SUN039 TaxID=2937787 RepID=UPI002164255E|nr:metalloregulator ArsR/SmtB family transcription factor [Sphingomonas sp. SUN039]UVO54875.1 metalloregulator ArsR/SmtB family transcription factor [Sphingomonas sp. SUN039]